MSNNGYSCEEHDKCWHLLSQSGDDLCAKCCQNILMSSLESDSTRIHLLSQIESSLKYGPKLTQTLFESQIDSGETQLFIETILRLLPHSDSQIRSLSQKCVTLLKTQINKQQIFDFVFEDIINKINSDKQYWNESSLELIADLIPDFSLAVHPLRNDLDILFKRFHFEFKRSDDRLKITLLKIFEKIYVNLESNPLFVLDNEFHSKTLSLIFNLFEELNDESNDRELVINSIVLLKKLSKMESILKRITTDERLTIYLQKLLGDKCMDIKHSVLDWICDLLEQESNNSEHIRRAFAYNLEKEMFDSFVKQLDLNPNIFKLLDCIYLIVENNKKTLSEDKIQLLSNAVIKSLQISVFKKDCNHFLIALAVLKKIIKRKSGLKIINDRLFYKILDLMELSITTPKLFTNIIEFCTDFVNLQRIPIMVPTKRMKNFLIKVLANIRNIGSDGKEIDCIYRMTQTVKLFKSYLKLINEVKNKDFDEQMDSENKEVHILNTDFLWSSIDVNLDETEDKDSVNDVSQNTDIFEFLSFCLKEIETIFINTLTEVLNQNYLEENSLLLQEICLTIEIIIKNHLLISKDVITFVNHMFSKGYVFSLLNVLCFDEFWPSNSELFISKLSSLLTQFLIRIQSFEEITENHFEENVVRRTLIQFKDLFSLQSQEFSEVIKENTEFLDTFFAINYFCHKFISSNDYEFDPRYNENCLRVLNTYLTNNLSDDFNSVLTIKYSLFLSSFSELENKSLKELKQFFSKDREKRFEQNIERDDTFYGKYYSNHLKLLEFMFTQLKCDKFSEFGLKQFLQRIPETFVNFDEKQKISSFFQLIESNEKAIQLLINVICDMNDDSVVDIILRFLEDSEMFVEDSDIYNSWQRFCDNLFENIELIAKKIIEKIDRISLNHFLEDEDDLISVSNSESNDKIIKLIVFLCRLLCNEKNNYGMESFDRQFFCLLENLCQMIDNNLNDSSAETIFKFFRICLNSNKSSELNNQLIAEYLLQSKTCVTLLFRYIDNDLPFIEDSEDSENKETALFLLSVLCQNKLKYDLDHKYVYELDINRLFDLLNSESKVVTENAFYLLSNSFETDLYFDSNKKSEEMKIEEMRKLLYCLQNSVCRQFISLTQMTTFLKEMFDKLKVKNIELMKDLANSRWFEVVIDYYLEADESDSQLVEDMFLEDNSNDEDIHKIVYSVNTKMSEEKQREKEIKKRKMRRNSRIFRKQFIDFVLIFLELDFVNTTLVKVMNEMTEKFLETIDRSEKEELIPNEDKLKDFLNIIKSGSYAHTLTQQNEKRLRKWKYNISEEHNYCHK